MSARLVVLRQWLGLSPHEMAARLGMAPRTYREWERPGGRKWRRVNQSPLVKIHAATGVCLNWFICGDHGDHPPDVPIARSGEPLPQPTRH